MAFENLARFDLARGPRDYKKLRFHEIFWRDHASLLMDHGYQLRPRYRPDWIPGWTGTNREPRFFEDARSTTLPQAIDAVRVADNREVFVKRIAKGSTETKILVYLSDPKFESDPWNHTVPLLELITEDKEYDFIVMPLLRRFNDPPFVSVDEVVDFMRQTLEGLVFLHRVGVAHRDCSNLNIMFDARAMYPRGFHPYRQYAKKDGMRVLREGDHYNRGDVLPTIHYYFIDFGLSSLFTDESRPRLVTGTQGQDETVPELSDEMSYDPFKADVYILGNLFKRTLILKYSNLSFLLPLVDDMTEWSFRSRPTAETCLTNFHGILQQQQQLSLRWMLLNHNLSSSQRLKKNVASLFRETRRLVWKHLGFKGWRLATVVFSSLTIASFVFGPRNILTQIRHVFADRHELCLMRGP